MSLKVSAVTSSVFGSTELMEIKLVLSQKRIEKLQYVMVLDTSRQVGTLELTNL